MTMPKDVRKGELTVGYVDYPAQKKPSIIDQVKKKVKKITG
jgi:hypothetical protein